MERVVLGMFTIDLGGLAAWVQGLGSLAAVVAAVCIAIDGNQKQKRRDKEARELAHLRITIKIANMEHAGYVFMEQLKLQLEKSQSIQTSEANTAIAQLERIFAFIDDLIIQEAADDRAIYYATVYRVAGEQASRRLRDSMAPYEDARNGVESSDGMLFIGNDKVQAILSDIRAMKSSWEATKEFSQLLKDDPNSELPKLIIEEPKLPAGQ